MDEITWDTDDLSIERVRRILGAAYVDGILASWNAEGICAGRARGAWDANEREYHAAYRSLAKIATEKD